VGVRDPATFRSTAVVVVAFAIAMGFLEAAVVVYLRAAMGVDPTGLIPLADPADFEAFAGVELARESATLVMIASVGWLAGRSGLERLAWAAVAFGTWDIVYYLGLWAAIGWPPTLDTWDILFLIPMTWVGPVWAPVAVSAALVGFGLAAARRLRAGRTISAWPVYVGVAVTGGVIVVVSFLLDSGRVTAGDPGAWSGWPLFWLGLGLAAAAAVAALSRRDDGRAASGEGQGTGSHGSDAGSRTGADASPGSPGRLA
jgi:hypothetical protein